MPSGGDGRDASTSSAGDSFLRGVAAAPAQPVAGIRGAPVSARFTVRRKLGEGGMGVVYEAFDEERKAPVALKTLNRFDGNALARFKREFRALQGLPHPNLVALNELVFENDEWFFTMELLDGVDFVSHVRGGAPRVAYASTIRESVGKLAAHTAVDSTDEEAVGAPRFDEPRLRDGLRQLLEGLAALHAADKVHRDVKPSNVLVTRDGRVVLLDFGLVTEASSDERSTGLGVVGTPAYMAPEQAASQDVGPAADLYAVGVVVYEALTGRVPIEGPHLQVLLAKQRSEPPPPASIASGVPSDLNELCVQLLRFDPSKRPSAEAILRRIPVPGRSGQLPRTSTESSTFVGRAAELAALGAAYDECVTGRLATVLVCGESGIGKSCMVRRFTGQLLADHPDAMLLEGRCYEREAVPYKTLDGIADALSRRLARLSASDAAALLPVRSAALGQMFPVMLRVPQIAKEHAALATMVEPQELRQRAFHALRELLDRIAVRRPTVVAIDDLQWADEDGLRALAEILRPPDPPPVLLIGTVRVATGNQSSALERLRAVLPGEVRVLALDALGREEARELAAALLRRIDRPDADPERLAAEACGHPLFVEELARHVALGSKAREDVKLDDAIWARVEALDPPTREMAELVALAGKPVPQVVVAAGAAIEPGEFNRRVAVLRASNIVRTGGARWADAIEPYHDRVREAVLSQLGSERKRSLHEALAIAFEASSHGDAETLAAHWSEAGNHGRAAKYAMTAGDQAAKTFAFDRAAQWYEQALTLLSETDPGRRELRIKLGDALGNAGRGALAAPHLERAASESPAGEALELRRRAADQLLRSGDFDAGTKAMGAVLAAVRMRLPRSSFGTLGMLAFYRAVLAIRGLRFREKEKGLIPSDRLTRIDTCLAAAMNFAMVEHVTGMVFATRALLLALDAGEIERIAHALGLEAALRGGPGGPSASRRAEPLLSIGRSLAERSGSPVARAFVHGGFGSVLWGTGRFRESVGEFERVLEVVKSGSPGLVFEATSVRQLMLVSLFFVGRYKALQVLQQQALRDALERGDKYAFTQMQIGAATIAWLAQDQPALAERKITRAIDDWSKQGFHLEHVDALLGRTYAALYAGDAETAFGVSGELLARARRALFWRVQNIRVRVLYYRAASAVAVAQHGDRANALREAGRMARALEAEGMSWVWPFVLSVRAGISSHEGRSERILSNLDEAAREFVTNDMLGYAAAARYHAAAQRGDAGEKEGALSYFRAEQVVAPQRMIRALIAGFPD